MKNLIVIFVFACFIDVSVQVDWSYGFEMQWPGICNTGTQQSPINIMSADAVEDVEQTVIQSPLVFRGYSNIKVQGENNGRTLQWNEKSEDIAPVISGGPLEGNYTFMQFHLHWLSEHAIDGMKYPLEIHMLHVKNGFSFEEALEQPDGLVVLAVFCLVRSGDHRALEEIMPVVPLLYDATQNKTETFDLDLSKMLSPDPQSYYTYQGSLTTPMCQEAVTWIVMDQPVYITDEQYKTFYDVDVGSSYNYRTLQPVNRVVYHTIRSSSSILVPSFITMITAFINCFRRH